MFEDIIANNIFVRIFIFAFTSILLINIITALLNGALAGYIKAKGLPRE